MYKKAKPPRLTVKVGDYVFASPDMLSRPIGNGKLWSKGIILQHNLEVILRHHNKRHAYRKKPVSYATMAKRAYEIKSAGWTLMRQGQNEHCPYSYPAKRIVIPTNMRRAHVLKLTRTWEADPSLSAATVMNKLSTLRTFFGWIGKSDLINSIKPDELFSNPELIKRTLIANSDKSWSSVNIDEIIDGIEKEDRHVAMQMRLSQQFGLRVKEAAMLRPKKDYLPEENTIHVHRGTKNGRQRSVLISTQEQQDVLNAAMAICNARNGSMFPPRYSLKQWMKHYYYIARKHGVTRKDGIVPHGLRHGFAHKLYLDKTGSTARVVDGGKKEITALHDQVSRLFISEQLGHSRKSIASAYGV